MERDPVRFVWRAAPGLNVALVGLALAALAGLWATLDLLRSAVDDAAWGRAYASGETLAPFLRFRLVLPDRILDAPLVLVPGFALGREALIGAVVAGILAVALGAGLVTLAANLLHAAIGRRAVAALSRRILDGIAFAPIAASDVARQSAEMAGRALVGQRRFLGSALGTPILAGGVVAMALVYVATLGLWLAFACLAGLAAFAVAATWREGLELRQAAAEMAAGEALRRALAALASHLSALAAHGTAAAEQRRIADDLAPSERPARLIERQNVAVSGLVAAAALLAPLGVFAAGVAATLAGEITPGQVVAAAVIAACAVVALNAIIGWRRGLARTRPVFAEVARQLGSFHARRRKSGGAALPSRGQLVAQDIATDPSPRDGRLAGLSLSVALPGHVALTGGPASGARAFAGLLGGQRVPRAGTLTFGGVDLLDAAPPDRAKILAYAGGETLILPKSLRANLLYGCPDPDAADIEERLLAAVTAAGLDALVYARGLAGAVDPRRDPALAQAVVAARARIRATLDARGFRDLVQPFDPAVYNPQATIGENILFGVALGDTFRDEHLPAHPFMRGLLDREGLTKPLAALGAAIAKSTLEMFSGLPEGSALLGRFSIFAGSDRESYERLLDRLERSQRGAAASRDGERLIALALRYSESRHRLGLLSPDLQARLLRVRAAFSETMPKSLEPAVEFFRPDRICASASLLDNLLFGRIAQDRASARGGVLAVVRDVLAEQGLDREVFRTGLETRLDPRGLSASESAAIDVARCLVRRPDNLVVEHALDDLSEADARTLLARLGRALVGRGLIVVLPPHVDAAGFDRVVAFEGGRAARDAGALRAAARPALSPVGPDPVLVS